VPILLLAQGDDEAKHLLKQAIEARYGIRPPALESLRVDFKGRTRAKVGPVTTWIPVEVRAYFQFPTSLRWDFSVKKIGIQLQSGVEAYDGNIYHRVRGNNRAETVTDAEQIDSMQKRLWAMAALLLTPLSENYIKLKIEDTYQFKAENTQLHNAVHVHLRPDYTLAHVKVTCLNPDSGREQLFDLRLDEEQVLIHDLMLPKKIKVFWDDDIALELKPVAAETNPQFPRSTFTLETSEIG